MEAFEYVAPRSLAEAYGLLGNGKRSQFLAGGTDIIVQLRERRKSCDQLIDLKKIPETTGFRFEPDGSLSIGAATACAELYENAEILRRLPGLVDAASLIGGIQIQSRASLGGNLSNASPAADSSPALMALGAQLVIGSASGQRTIPIEEYFTGPGRNALQTGELLVRIIVPSQPTRSGTFYHRFIPRNEMDIAVASAGVRLVLNAAGDRIESARVALGAVGSDAAHGPRRRSSARRTGARAGGLCEGSRSGRSNREPNYGHARFGRSKEASHRRPHPSRPRRGAQARSGGSLTLCHERLSRPA